MTQPQANHSAVAAARLRQEASDLSDRSRPSGVFYLIGWLVVANISDWFSQQPLVSWALTLLLTTLAALRLRQRIPVQDTAAAHETFITRCWTLIYLNVASWSAIVVWSLLSAAPASVKTVALICTIMYGSAFGYAYCMRYRRAAIGLLLIAAPATLVLWTQPEQRVLALAFSVYLTHLLIVTRTSTRGYQQRLDLDAQLREQRNLYEQLSRIDGLTGLYNRGHFNGRLRDALAGDAGVPQRFAFVLLDIDHFKRINDSHGHASGDRCLQTLADTLRALFATADDYLARIGGEEFAILLNNHDTEGAMERVRVLRSRLRELERQGAIGLTVSAGVGACQRGERMTPEAFYHAVDLALYRAKSSGRDRVCCVVDTPAEQTAPDAR